VRTYEIHFKNGTILTVNADDILKATQVAKNQIGAHDGSNIPVLSVEV